MYPGITYRWSLFFRDCLGQADHARLRCRIIGLAKVPVSTACRAYVYDGPRLAVAHPEVRRRFSEDPECGGEVHRENGLPLLVRDFVDGSVLGKPRVIDEEMDLALAKLGSALEYSGDVAGVRNVAWYRNSVAWIDFIY